MQVSVPVVEKTELNNLSDDDLVFLFDRVVAVEKLLDEMKKELRHELIARFGKNAVIQCGNTTIVIKEVERQVLNTRKVKVFLKEIGKLDEFMKSSKFTTVRVV